jgi:hypothetical protein
MHESPMVSSPEIYELTHRRLGTIAYSRGIYACQHWRPAGGRQTQVTSAARLCQDPDHAKLVKDTRAVLSPDEEVPTFF